MRKFLYPLQKICLFVFYLETVIIAPKQYFIGISTIIIILSLIYQGARPYTPLLFVVTLLYWFQFHYLKVIMVVIVGTIMILCKLYRIHVPQKGPYKVGYRKTNIHGVDVCIFYPTHQCGQKVPWIPNGRYQKTLYQIFYVDPRTKRLPYHLFVFVLSYINKIFMEVQGNTNLHIQKDHKFKVMLYSHGLGANMNAYSSTLCYWASHGRIALALNHQKDHICVDFRKVSETDQKLIVQHLYKSRNNDLKTRVKQFGDLWYSVDSKNLLEYIFQIEIPIEGIYLAGQSFGATTALETYTSNINRKCNHQILGIILQDPWLFPLSQQTYTRKIQKQILIVNSHTFYGQVPKFYVLEQKLNRLTSTNPKRYTTLMVKNMDHLNQSDMAYVFGNLLSLTGSIKYHNLVDRMMGLNHILIQMFIDNYEEESMIHKGNQYVSINKMKSYGVIVEKQWRYSRKQTVKEQQNQKDK